jgi:RNA polymerase sigma-70 factor (ECF subfamily)
MEATDDRALLLRTVAGDPRAFDLFVTRWERPLHRFLRRLVGPSLVDDVRQQTFVRVFTHADTHRGGSVRSWVFRIAYTVAINALRAERRRPEQVADLLPERFDRTPAPDVALAAREERARLHRALDRLDAPDRALVWLRTSQDLTFADIAAVTDLPATTVRRRYVRALAALRRELREASDAGRT